MLPRKVGGLGGAGAGGSGLRAPVAREEGAVSGLRSLGGLVSLTSSPRARDCEGGTWETPGARRGTKGHVSIPNRACVRGGDTRQPSRETGGLVAGGRLASAPLGGGVPAHQPGQQCQQLIPSEAQAELSRGSRSHRPILRNRKAEAMKAGREGGCWGEDGGLTPSHVWVHQVES